VVNTSIGETEMHLERIFDMPEADSAITVFEPRSHRFTRLKLHRIHSRQFPG
jgi:hypothetical protein